MRAIALIEDPVVVRANRKHLGLWQPEPAERVPPGAGGFVRALRRIRLGPLLGLHLRLELRLLALCIHPNRIAAVGRGFAPSGEEMRWARAVLGAFENAAGSAVRLDGKLIDLPVVERARRLLADV